MLLQLAPKPTTDPEKAFDESQTRPANNPAARNAAQIQRGVPSMICFSATSLRSADPGIDGSLPSPSNLRHDLARHFLDSCQASGPNS